jgi:RimJ/RimL family protein N-acetyltransferase
MTTMEGGDAPDATVSLRPIGEDDLPPVIARLADPDSMSPFQWFGWSDPHRWRREWAENGLLGPNGGRLLVVEGGQSAGFVAWRRIDRGVSSCWNAGIVLWPHARGRGIGTRAQRLLVRYLFAHTLAARVESDTDVDNIAEQRALEKAGFTREGVLRSYGFRDGAWHDSVLYAVVRSDLVPETG